MRSLLLAEMFVNFELRESLIDRISITVSLHFSDLYVDLKQPEGLLEEKAGFDLLVERHQSLIQGVHASLFLEHQFKLLDALGHQPFLPFLFHPDNNFLL